MGFVRYCDCDNRDCDLDCDLDNHDPTAIATATLHAMQQTQEALSKHVRRDSVPTLSPDVVHRLDILSGYARRAESELAHYGLKAADYETTSMRSSEPMRTCGSAHFAYSQ